MMWQDCVNGLYESLGGFAILLSIRQVCIDKCVRGVSLIQIIFFTTWGYWNLYYYYQLHQIMSWIGGIGVVTMNTIWLGLLIYYGQKDKKTQEYNRQMQSK